MGIMMVSLLILAIEPTFGLTEKKGNLNSNDFFDTILTQNIKNIAKICSYEYCDTFRGSNVEKGIEIFKTNYFQYLKTKTTEEEALSTLLKGFPITEVEWIEESLSNLSCVS